MKKEIILTLWYGVHQVKDKTIKLNHNATLIDLELEIKEFKLEERDYYIAIYAGYEVSVTIAIQD